MIGDSILTCYQDDALETCGYPAATGNATLLARHTYVVEKPLRSKYSMYSITCDLYMPQGSASVIQTDAMGELTEVAHLDDGSYFGEVRVSCVDVHFLTSAA